MTEPSTMLAIDPAAPGGPEVLVPVERPVPTPEPGEVLVRVRAAGVNRPDVLQRMGLYPMPPNAPTIMGLEIAGEIVAVGQGVARPEVGDKVCALLAGGGYAQYAAVPAGQCLPIPQGLSFVEAASLPETYFTVWSNLFERAFATEGDTVLVHGGTSGIGVTAILLAKAFGLRVIVTCGSDEKCAAARALGADVAINYNAGDFAELAREANGGRGVDVVLDMVGGDYVPKNIALLADEGRHVSIAFQRGPRADLDLSQVMRKRLILSGSMLRPRTVAYKSALADSLVRDVWPLFAQGKLRAIIDSTFPLADAAEAHRRMEAGEHVGKIVLEVP
ncbi:NAD(P)H-quinone oxidoreductase [Sphingoaurantiacus capsulatus]|uniref:NAD(P)H-quinone oxidoreductase n=1 Tax=Sphingoaurantiacus capsulatus TaxID=1771310 RepID=A0ABV7X9F8_9SPHN